MCKCRQFYSDKAMENQPCRFSKHPGPALCGREDSRPVPPEPNPWELITDWYTTDPDNS